MNFIKHFLIIFIIFDFLSSKPFLNISFSDLPKQSQDFVNKHFKSLNIVSVTKDRDNFVIRFNDGVKLEFIINGDFSEASIPNDVYSKEVNGLSVDLLPTQVATAINRDFISKYPYMKIYSIDKDRRGYEVELKGVTMEVDVKYDENGNIIDKKYDSEDD